MGHLVKQISISQTAKYTMCPYAWHLGYVEKLETIRKSRGLYLGSLIHNVLEKAYNQEAWLDYLHDINKKLTLEDKMVLGHDDVLWLEDTVKAFMDFNTTDLRVVKSEVKINAKVNGMRLVGYVDNLSKSKGKGKKTKYWIVEYKSSSTAFPGLDSLMFREQPYIYLYLLEKMYDIEIEGVIWHYLTNKPLAKVVLKKDGQPTVPSYSVTPYMWLKEFPEQEVPLSCTYDKAFKTVIVHKNKHHIKKIVKNFFAKAGQVGLSKHANYSPEHCSRMCDFNEWCKYETKGLDPKTLMDVKYKRKEERKNED